MQIYNVGTYEMEENKYNVSFLEKDYIFVFNYILMKQTFHFHFCCLLFFDKKGNYEKIELKLREDEDDDLGKKNIFLNKHYKEISKFIEKELLSKCNFKLLVNLSKKLKDNIYKSHVLSYKELKYNFGIRFEIVNFIKKYNFEYRFILNNLLIEEVSAKLKYKNSFYSFKILNSYRNDERLVDILVNKKENTLKLKMLLSKGDMYNV